MNLVTRELAEKALGAIASLIDVDKVPRNASVRLSAAVRILEQYRWQTEQDPHNPNRYVKHFLDLFQGDTRAAYRWLGANYEKMRESLQLPESTGMEQ